jgi:hypothetical protein
VSGLSTGQSSLVNLRVREKMRRRWGLMNDLSAKRKTYWAVEFNGAA